MRWQASRQAGWRYWLIGSRKLKVGGALVLMAALIVSPIFMGRSAALTAGPNSPTAATTPSGTAWTSPANVYAQDSTYASYAIASAGTSSALNITGFGFNIPTGSTINGITATVWRYAPSNSKAAIQDSNVQLLLANVASGSNQGATSTTWPTADGSTSYGSTSSLWGATVAPADVNNTGFGLTITAKNVKSGGGASNTAYIDYASLTVTYTPPPVSYNQASYRLYQNQDAATQQGNPTWTKTTYSTDASPGFVATADFNGDGKPDIATDNGSATGTVNILLGTGSGSFSAKTSIVTDTNPKQIVVADINTDGKPDLVIAMDESPNGYIDTLLNTTPTGSMTPSFTKNTAAVGNSIWYLTVGDFNGDGKPDLAVSGAGAGNILLNSTASGASNSSYGTNFQLNGGSCNSLGGIVAADIDGDGKQDLITGLAGGNIVCTYLGSGSGTFTASSTYTIPTFPTHIITADFNGDNKPDFAVVTQSGISVLINNGTGTLSDTNYSTTNNSGTYDLAAGDGNCDGKTDVVFVGGTSSNTLSVLPGTGTGTFNASYDMSPAPGVGASSNPEGVAAADLNGDSCADPVVANSGDNDVAVYINSGGSGPITSINVGSALATPNTAATISGDGQPFRLRMDVGVSTSNLAANGQSFKLQYAPMTTSCDTGFTNTPASAYADVTDTSTVKYYDNPVAVNGTSLTTNTNDPTDGTNTTANGGVIPESYQEKGTTTFTNPTSIPAGKDGMWDFALTTSQTLAAQHYCMRIVKSDGTALDTYTVIPEIIMPATAYNQAAYRLFNGSSNSSAKTFVVGWGGINNDYGYSLVQTSDGGYAVTGYTASFGSGNNTLYLAKYNSSGVLSWSRTWSSGSNSDGYSVIQTSDGGYAIAGDTYISGGSGYDMLLIKYDSNGTLSWSRTWGGASSDYGTSLVQTSDGGYAVTGYTASFGAGSNDMFLAKYDSTGTLSWSHTWGGTGDDYGQSLIQTSDGGYAITGYTYSFGDPTYGDMFLAKYDSTGTLSWSRTWANPALNSTDMGYSLIQTSDGGYIVVGYTGSASLGTGDMFQAKYDSTGTLSWSHTWGSNMGDCSHSCHIIKTSDGGYAITGDTKSYGAGGKDMFLAKYDSTSTLSWSRTWGSSNTDEGDSIVQTSDGGYAVSGESAGYGAGNYDMILAKYDSSGNIANCSSPMCQSPSATTSTLTASTTTPSVTTSSPTSSTSTFTPTSASPTPTQTVIVAVTGGVDAGSSLANQNTGLTFNSVGTPFRLRMDLGVLNSGVATSGQSFKLQYANKTSSCSASTYADITTGTPVAWYDNTSLTDGDSISANVNDPADGTNPNVAETYQESNPFTNSGSAIYAGQDGLWDFSLIMPSTDRPSDICLRVVKNDGTPLTTYTVYPELQFGPRMPQLMRQGKWFNSSGVLQNYFLKKY